MASRWLLLHGWSSTRHKAINRHCPLCQHVFTLIEFSFKGVNIFNNCFLDFLNESFGFDKGCGFDRGRGFNRGLGLRGASS